MMVRYIAPTLTRLGVLMAHPAAFLVLTCYVGAWLVFNPKSFDWQSVATVATWLMTLFIQRAEHRDDEEPEVIAQHRLEERHSFRSGQ